MEVQSKKWKKLRNQIKKVLFVYIYINNSMEDENSKIEKYRQKSDIEMHQYLH